MSAYKPSGGALGWGGEEQLAVPRTPRLNRHHSTSHPGHQRMVRYDQGRHREDRRQVSTHYIRIFYPVISISILQLSTLNCSRQEAGPGGGAAGGNLRCFSGPSYELATISSRRPLTSFSGKIIPIKNFYKHQVLLSNQVWKFPHFLTLPFLDYNSYTSNLEIKFF